MLSGSHSVSSCPFHLYLRANPPPWEVDLTLLTEEEAKAAFLTFSSQREDMSSLSKIPPLPTIVRALP